VDKSKYLRLQSPKQLIMLFVNGKRGRQTVFREDLELVRKAWLSLDVSGRAVLSGLIRDGRRLKYG
jgi:hypothetical protein